jgi:hypothetical protein
VDSGHGTSAASSAGTTAGGVSGGGGAVSHNVRLDSERSVDSATAEISLVNSSYVKIPPVDSFLASLTANTVSVSPPSGDNVDCSSLSSPTFATFHPGRMPVASRNGYSNNNGEFVELKLDCIHLSNKINV